MCVISRACTGTGSCLGFSGLGVLDGARRGKGPCCPCTWMATWVRAQGMEQPHRVFMGIDTCTAVV